MNYVLYMEYKIITTKPSFGSEEKSIQHFEEEVNKSILQGWLPQGGLIRSAKGGIFYQAMIKHE